MVTSQPSSLPFVSRVAKLTVPPLAPACSVVLALGAVLAGCYDMRRVDPGPEGVVLVPDEDGLVDNRTMGVRGRWYSYGDRYGEDRTCKFPPYEDEQCSEIEAPHPPGEVFRPDDGKLCTQGSAAVVLCKNGAVSCGESERDYSNIWGAGIGLNLNTLEPGGGAQAEKSEWNAFDYGVTGVSFEIETLDDQPELRVEFPITLPDGTLSEETPRRPDGSVAPTTETVDGGSPYWGATSAFPDSAVKVGTNSFFWEDVRAPRPEYYTFDARRILAIQFHVPAVRPPDTERRHYHFCLKNLTLLRE